MWIVKGAVPATVSFIVVSAVTAVLWYFKLASFAYTNSRRR